MPETSGPRSSGHDDTALAADRSAHDDTIAADPSVTEGRLARAARSTLRDPPAFAPRGEDRYRLGAEIGRGGMGRVVEAFDTHLGRTVALKEVLPAQSASIARRFQREVRITARLEHASIVPLYDSGLMADGRPYYVMRRVSGRPLDELIARARGLDERLALLPNLLAATDAVAHAHRRGVIHRDLKPSNILVGELGETVVIDWGLAKVIGEDDASEPPEVRLADGAPAIASDSLQTQAGAVFGTPGFMAPEQARGDEPGPGSDVYALGATLYQLLAGKPPVRGTSATEVIASTLAHEIVPLATVAPDAPAELSTIINKALAREVGARYVDAGALAEDVRRFLTGQLVAAHRYTRRQRLVRFARRHRAALSVAALAATAVAVLSWVSVHRILRERDAATTARQEAEHQRAVADRNASEARERADQLLLAHARSLLDTSPTQAIAALADIARASSEPATASAHPTSISPRAHDEARAIAKAAVARGVAWGVPSLPGPTTSFEMTRDGSRLLQVSRAGALQIVDLVRKKQDASITLGSGATATWVGDDKLVLVDRFGQPPGLYDPATGNIAPLAAPPSSELAKTPDGHLVAYIDETGNVGVIDIAARSTTTVWSKRNAERSVAIAPDGSWLAFGERLDAKRERLVVIDRAGKVLVQRAGTPVVLAASARGALAASFFDEIVELQPGGATTKLPLEPKEARLVHQLVYRDVAGPQRRATAASAPAATSEVLQLVGGKGVITYGSGRLVRGDSLADTVYFAQVASDFLVLAANDNHVHLLRGDAHLALPLTEAPEGMYRLATARDTTRVAATAKDAILVWDAAPLFAPVVDIAPGMYVDQHHVVVPQGPLSQWFLWRFDTNERTPLALPVEGVPLDHQALADERRMIVVAQTPRGTSVVTVRADATSELSVDDLGGGRVAIVPGNAIIYSVGKNRIFGKVGAEASRELVSLDGDVRSLAANGPLGYVALSTTGELVRGTFGGASFARTRVDDLDNTAFVVADRDRNAIVGSGNRLLRWRGDLHEMARFSVPIDYVVSTDIGLYVSLTNKDLMFVPAAGNQTPVRVPVAQLSSISADGRVVAGLTPTQQIELVDMPSLAKWTLPKLFSGFPRVALSPDGRILQQSLGTRVALWRLRQPGSDFAAWLLEQTNAVEEDGAIRWPWQP